MRMNDEEVIFSAVEKAIQAAVNGEVEKALKTERICCLVEAAIKKYINEDSIFYMVQSYMEESDAIKGMIDNITRNLVKEKFGKK